MDYYNFFDNYDILHFLGNGTYGSVYKILHKISNKEYAMKVSTIKNNISRESLREISLLKLLNKYDKVVKLHDIIIFKYEGNDSLGLIMELGKCNLYNEHLNNHEIIKTLLDITNGLKLLYDLGYIHNDLNPNNVVKFDDRCKIVDYGFSTRLYRYNGICYIPTINYRCPEIKNKKKVYPNKIDIWSLGMIFYYLLFNGTINKDTNINTFLNLLKFDDTKNYTLFNKLTSIDPTNRYDITELLDDKTIQSYTKYFKYDIDNISILNNDMTIGLSSKSYSREAVLDILLTLISNNKLSYEIIINSFFYIDKLIQHNEENDILEILPIIFWLSVRIVTMIDYKVDSIRSLYYKLFNKKLSNKYIYQEHNRICQLLNYDLDPLLSYSYIRYINEKEQLKYRNILLNLILYPEINKISEFNKAVICYIILDSSYDNNKFDDLIKEGFNKGLLHICSLYEWYMKCSNYMESMVYKKLIKIIPEILEIKDYDYSKIFEKWLDRTKDIFY
jgi:serine/threonine protein kinase